MLLNIESICDWHWLMLFHIWTRLDLARLTAYTWAHIFWWVILIRCIFTVMCRLQTGATTTGATRSKGYTNPATLANLAEREESHSSLYLSTVELIKTLMKINCQLLCWPWFSCILALTLACSIPQRITSSSQSLLSSWLVGTRETLRTRLVGGRARFSSADTVNQSFLKVI